MMHQITQGRGFLEIAGSFIDSYVEMREVRSNILSSANGR